MTLIIDSGYTWDADATAYIEAVEAADTAAGQSGGLEESTRKAIENFVVGCKADGNWNAIKASCILAGARTLSGALTTLKPSSAGGNIGPTNVGGLFVSGDYNRKTGLVGNGSTKYLDSNRTTNSDPQNNYSVSVWIHTAGAPSNSTQLYLSGGAVSGGTALGMSSSQLFSRNRNSGFLLHDASTATGFFGSSRSESATYITRNGGINTPRVQTSQSPSGLSTQIFADSPDATFKSNARIAFYSIGESLDLALLDARVTTLINSFATSIP